jgi:hypothetical protein
LLIFCFEATRGAFDDGGAPDAERFLVCATEREAALLVRAPHCVVDCALDAQLMGAVGALLRATAECGATTNVLRVSPGVLVATMPLLLPSQWKGQGEVAWDPPAAGSEEAAALAAVAPNAAPPTREWIRCFWQYVRCVPGAGAHAAATTAPEATRGADDGAVLALFAGDDAWPLLPATCGSRSFLLSLGKVSVLLFTVTFHANRAHSLTRSP